jgi:VCBS repeat-containing protein
MAIKTGTAASEVLNSTAVADRLLGMGGNDTLNGNGGNDTLEGGAGNDRLVGGTGNDVYIFAVGGGTDTIVEVGPGGGTDTLRSAVTVAALANHVENLVLTGGAAINGTGNTSDNKITGNTGANKLSGAGGNDTLDGGGGADTTTGGAGNDVHIVAQAGDKVLDSTGIDTVRASVTFTLGAGVDNLVLTGAGPINGTGNGTVNTLTGNIGSNKLSGLGGNDKLSGSGGNDTLDGGTGDDTTTGGAGNDVHIVGEAGDVVVEAGGGGTDTVRSSLLAYTLGDEVENLVITVGGEVSGTGNGKNNVITGGSGDNILAGLAGNDVLTGGAGQDQLFGGEGDDVLVYDVNDILNGGDGTDTIRLTGSTELLVNDDSFYADMEAFDLAGTNTLHLLEGGIINFVATGLRVDGGAGDLVTVQGDWTLGEAPETIGGAVYDVWTQGIHTLKIEQGIEFQDVNHAPDIPTSDTIGEVTAVADGEASAAGTIAFDDQDLHDGHTVSVTPDEGNVLGINLDPDPLEITVEATGEATGTIGWTYTVDGENAAVKALAQGETVIETFTVTVTDDRGATDNHIINITVTGANDAPEITVPPAPDVAMGLEGANIAITGIVVADDNDGDIEVVLEAGEGTITTLPPGAGLVIDGSGTGTVTLTGTVAEINAALSAVNGIIYNGGDFFLDTLTVTADDGIADPVSEDIAITLTNVNDAPSGSDNTVVVSESGTYTFATGDFAVLDSEGNSLASVIINTLPSSGDLQLSGAPVSGGATISVADIMAGNLAFLQDDEFGADTSFTFTVVDNGGTANGGVNTDPSPNTMTIDQLDFLDTLAPTANAITGNEGAERLSGLGLNDKLDGAAGNDTLYGGMGTDTLIGGDGEDRLEGGDDNDLITGGGDNDVIIAGAGNDTMTGGAGADAIVAGSGDDVVIYSSAADGAAAGAASGNDIVQQFGSPDKIHFEGTLGEALDDGTGGAADDGLLTMPFGGEADFRGTSDSEGMIYLASLTDSDLIQSNFTNVLDLINGLGVVSENGDDALFVVRGTSTTGLYYYVESTGGGDGFDGGDDVSAAELSLLAIVNTATLDTSGFFTTDQ